MKRMLIALLIPLLLFGCEHTELKAPCTDKYASTARIDCDERQPINVGMANEGRSNVTL